VRVASRVGLPVVRVACRAGGLLVVCVACPVGLLVAGVACRVGLPVVRAECRAGGLLVVGVACSVELPVAGCACRVGLPFVGVAYPVGVPVADFACRVGLAVVGWGGSSVVGHEDAWRAVRWGSRWDVHCPGMPLCGVNGGVLPGVTYISGQCVLPRRPECIVRDQTVKLKG
jgi:hypothetical protein